MANAVTQPKQDSKPAMKTSANRKDFIFAVGRRREAVARVRLYEHLRDDLNWDGLAIKKGDILVNAKPMTEYFSTPVMRHMLAEPFRVTNTTNKYTLTIKIAGGGPSGQLDAAINGIANALSRLDAQEYRSILKKKGFLTRDARVRERRKVGNKGKARRKMSSPKR